MAKLSELAELAFRAIAVGDEPPERLAEFMEAAQPRLASYIDSHDLNVRDRELLAGISTVMAALRGATMRPPKTKRWVELKGSRANKRHQDTLQAAKLVLRLEGDRKLESALQAAIEKYGVSRSAILAWRKGIKGDEALLLELDELLDPATSKSVGQ